MHNRTIDEVVLNAISDIKDISADAVTLDAAFVADLRMTSDDFTFVFVPMVDRALGVKTTAMDWKGVRTVDDAIRMLSLKYPSRE